MAISFSPLGTLADRDIYSACVNFFELNYLRIY